MNPFKLIQVKDAIDQEILHNALRMFYRSWDSFGAYAREIKRVAEDLKVDTSDFDIKEEEKNESV